MKIRIDLDCSPEEARRLLGLPDVQPMQEALVEELEKRMRAGLEAMDPETMVKTWLPLGLQGLETVQKMFWDKMAQAAGEARTRAGTDRDKTP